MKNERLHKILWFGTTCEYHLICVERNKSSKINHRPGRATISHRDTSDLSPFHSKQTKKHNKTATKVANKSHSFRQRRNQRQKLNCFCFIALLLSEGKKEQPTDIANAAVSHENPFQTKRETNYCHPKLNEIHLQCAWFALQWYKAATNWLTNFCWYYLYFLHRSPARSQEGTKNPTEFDNFILTWIYHSITERDTKLIKKKLNESQIKRIKYSGKE